MRAYQEIGKAEAKLAVGGGQATGGALDRGLLRRADDLLRRRQLRAHRARRDLRPGRRASSRSTPRRTRSRIANDTYYGLAAAVWTRDIFRAMRTVKSLRAGIVWVNHMQPTYVEAPWGGYKQSGIGRELGRWGVEEYLQVKQVHINLNEQPIGWYRGSTGFEEVRAGSSWFDRQTTDRLAALQQSTLSTQYCPGDVSTVARPTRPEANNGSESVHLVAFALSCHAQ